MIRSNECRRSPVSPKPKPTRIVAATLLLFIANLAYADVNPTEGMLQAVDKTGQPVGLCPLKHTDVAVDISGFIARVTLKQQFENPYPDPIEAVYIFPMSDKAAVDAMTMKIGDRIVKGVIKEREEARRIYEAAKNAGKAASLLDQERPNIFTQSVANILPSSAVEIEISYVEFLTYEDGEYEFSFPMVVGPRYIPGEPTQTPVPLPDITPGLRPATQPTDQVPDANRITPPVTPEGTRAGHDIALTVHLDAGVTVQDVRSELHDIETDRPSEHEAVVRLANKDEIPNRDFVLKYRVAGGEIADAVLTHADERGGFFTLILQPPKRVSPETVTPKEMLFVIDKSGSMSGFPIEKAKKTMKMCIEQMNPDDTFNLVTFSGGVGYCFERPMPNTPENRQKALDYLTNLEGGGGTEMMKAIQAALENQNDPKRLRIVCFMTDGFIGNDMAILDAIQKNAKTARVFAFGIGNGVNRFLIEGMGKAGRGASEIVTLESDGDKAAKRFHERIHSPLLTDVSLDTGNLAVEDTYPPLDSIPDLFAAQPLIIKGRYAKPGEGAVTVRGKTASGPFERSIPVRFLEREPAHDVLAPLWARARIENLMEQDWAGIQHGTPKDDIKSAITKLGLEYNLVTQFTSFVAVEEKVINEGGKTKTVLVPVEMTDGVSYEGVFGENAPQLAKGAAVSMQRVPKSKELRAEPSLGDAAAVKEEVFATQEQAKPLPQPEVAPPRNERDESDADKQKALPKLHPDLRALVENPNKPLPENSAVRVRDGWVEVVIVLSDDSQPRLDELTKLGADIRNHTRAGKKALVRIEVTKLVRIAALDFVTQVMPPAS